MAIDQRHRLRGMNRTRPSRNRNKPGRRRPQNWTGDRGPMPSGTLPPGHTTPPNTTPPPGHQGPINLPAPPQPENELARQNARTQYAMNEAENRRRVYQAALNYGDTGEINRLAALGHGPQLNEAPMSALADIGRREASSRRQLGEQTNAQNTFFSGLHLRDQGRLSEGYGLERGGATQEYLEAAAELANLLSQAGYERDEAISAADLADIRTAESKKPEPQADVDAPKPPSKPGGGHGGPGGGNKGGRMKAERKAKTQRGNQYDKNKSRKRRGKNLRKKKPDKAYQPPGTRP